MTVGVCDAGVGVSWGAGVYLCMCNSGKGLLSQQLTGHAPQNGKYKYTTVEELFIFIY